MSLHLRVETTDGLNHDLVGVGKHTIGHLEMMISEPSVDRIRVSLESTGNPAFHGTPDIVGIVGAGLAIPDTFAGEFMEQRGARRVPGGWELMSRDSLHPAHPKVPGSDQFHFLEGGERAVWDFTGPRARVPMLERGKQLAREWLLMNDAKLAAWPRLQRAKDLFRFDPKRFGVKDWIWYLFNFRDANSPNVGSWHGFGQPQWASAGYSNYHYAGVARIIESCVRANDQTAFEIAYYIAREQAWHGFNWSAKGHPWFRHMTRYESGTGRIGAAGTPHRSHDWIEGIWLAAELSGDIDLRKACELHGEAALASGWKWTRTEGVRQCSRFLRGLRCHFKRTGDTRFLARGDAEIIRVFVDLKPSEMWWPNDGTRETVKPAHDPCQDAEFMTELFVWRSLLAGFGYATPWYSRLKTMAEWCAEHMTSIVASAIGPVLECGYVGWGATATYKIEPGFIGQAAEYVGLLWILDKLDSAKWNAKYRAAVNACAGAMWQTWSLVAPSVLPGEDDFGNTAYGSAKAKTVSKILYGCVDEVL